MIALVCGCRFQASRPLHDDSGSPGDTASAGPDAWAQLIDANSSPLVDAPAVHLDAQTPLDAVVVHHLDAAPDATVYTGSDAGTANVVSCYSEGNPTATCTLPTHCCFTNYSAQHNGACTSAVCTYGTITCDGPEDCPSDQRCCAHALQDVDGVTIGYTLACSANACGPTPLNQELCHPTSGGAAGTCSNGAQSCVNTFNVDNDLPRSLYICH